jgi:hypothetical protein
MIALLAAALLLAAGDPPEPQLDLTPLVPAKPAAKPVKKKKKKPVRARPNVDAELPLPPLVSPPLPGAPQPVLPPAIATPAAPPPEPPSQVPPAPPLIKPVNEVGVLVQMDTQDAALEKQLGDSVRAIVLIGPRMHGARLLKSSGGGLCEPACLARLAAAEKLDRIVTVTHADDTIAISVFDSAANREVSQESRATDADPRFNLSTAEMLACSYLVPEGCTGEVIVNAPPGVTFQLDASPRPPGAKQQLPVGVHYFFANTATGSSRAQRISVLRESNPQLYVAVFQNAPSISLTPPPASAAPAVPVPPAALAAGPIPAPAPSHTLRPVGYALLGAAVVAGGIGTYLGVKSRSDLNSAEAGFNQNGGAYSAVDLSNLNSGNSAAHGANGLFIAAGALAIVGAAIALAF